MLAVPSPVESLAGIHQKWQGQEKTTLSAAMTDGSPQIHPFFQINLWLTQGLKQHHRAEAGEMVNTASDP